VSHTTPVDEQDSLRAREAALRHRLAGLPSLIVAYSGGVDSAYLGWVATDVLHDRALCVTADSPSYPERHRQMALDIAREFRLQHEIVRTGELARAEYRANEPDRCYHCKHELYTTYGPRRRPRVRGRRRRGQCR
jgi:uncharacterized protein